MTHMNFPLARYRFECVAQTSHRLPFYSGSMLRGSFGHALRRIVCMTGQRDCTDCPLVATCPYTQVFEPTAAPAAPRHATLVPYVVEPPPPGRAVVAAGEHFSFHMVLFGPALAQLPVVIFAWQRALERGLGRERNRSMLRRVVLENAVGDELPVYGDELTRVVEHEVGVQVPQAVRTLREARLVFTTPTRLLRRGQPVQASECRARDVLETLARRQRAVAAFAGIVLQAPDPRAIGETADALEFMQRFRWTDWQRWSSRQQQEMHLGGFTGECTLRGDLAPFAELLYLGQWLHLGKNTTFGMGRYVLEPGIAADDVR